MKSVTFWFDVVSPYAWLAFELLPRALAGCTHEVAYRPVLLAGLLKHWGHVGPAELPTKRVWTYRHVAWLAHHHGVVLDMPAAHPFNPLPLLRLSLACAPAGGTPNRRIVEAVMRHVWCGGAEATDPARLQALRADLAPARDPAADDVKRELIGHTDDAISQGLFGVPSFEVDGRMFWGLDALPMLAAALRDDPWFDGPGWTDDHAGRPGVARNTRP